MTAPYTDATYFAEAFWTEETPLGKTSQHILAASLDHHDTLLFEPPPPETGRFGHEWSHEVLAPVGIIWAVCFAIGALGAWVVC